MKVGEIWKTKKSAINSIKNMEYKDDGWNVEIIKIKNDCVFYNFKKDGVGTSAKREAFLSIYEKDYEASNENR